MATQQPQRTPLQPRTKSYAGFLALCFLLFMAITAYIVYRGWGAVAMNYALYAMFLYGWPHAITVIAILLIYVFRIAIKEWITRLAIEYTPGGKLRAYPVPQQGEPGPIGLMGIPSTESRLTGTLSVETHPPKATANSEPPEPTISDKDVEQLANAFPELAEEINSSLTREFVQLIPGALQAKDLKSSKQQLTAMKYGYVIALRETEFERIYMNIYRSQSVVLRLMSESLSGEMPISNLERTFEETFKKNQTFFKSNNFDYNAWVGFLVRNRLITLRTNEMARIEEKGLLYMSYIRKRNYSLDGPPWHIIF